jgi:hypothetical protein
MGVIRKKIAARGGEGGVKYVCDVCSADITSTVSAHFIPIAALPAHALEISPAISRRRACDRQDAALHHLSLRI